MVFSPFTNLPGQLYHTANAIQILFLSALIKVKNKIEAMKINACNPHCTVPNLKPLD